MAGADVGGLCGSRCGGADAVAGEWAFHPIDRDHMVGGNASAGAERGTAEQRSCAV